jgi:glycosyltransferase involved in cell wall biosynthesis
MSVTAAFTNFNRTDLLFEAIDPFLFDNRISEVVIYDDASRDDVYQTILWKYNGIDKVKIFKGDTNIDCYRAKRQAVKRASNEWVLLLDSDNIFSQSFIDVIFSQRPWNNSWAYAPEWARPHFDFRKIAGTVLSKNNIAGYMDKHNTETMLNAMNYFVNKEEFLRVWDGEINPVTSDSIFQNYNWLKGGNSIFVLPGMQYDHRVHDGSHYQNNVSKTPNGLHNSIVEKLKNMK